MVEALHSRIPKLALLWKPDSIPQPCMKISMSFSAVVETLMLNFNSDFFVTARKAPI